MNEELAQRAKDYAARTNRTFTELIEAAVSDFIVKPRAVRKPDQIKLPVAGNPKNRISDEEYRQMIERMYEEEAQQVWKMGGGHNDAAGR